jgi:hypothetical protein
MKKFYFIIALLVACSILVWSCKKDHKQPQPGEKTDKTYNLTIGVSGDGFTQQISTNANSKIRSLTTSVSDSASLAGLIDQLYIYIIDSQGYIKYKFTQTNTSVGFGVIKTVIVPGNYQLAVFGCKDGVTVTSYDKSATVPTAFADASSGWDNNLEFNYSFPWSDCFSYNAPLVVQASDLNRNVTLSRIISQVKVVIKDAIPASVKTMILTVPKGLSTYHIFTDKFAFVPNGVDAGTSLSVAIPDSLIGKKNFSISMNLGNDTSRITPSFTCYGNNYSIIATRKFDPIVLSKNQQVVYTINNMFGGNGTSSGSSFQVSINTGWKPTVITQPF